LSTKKIKTQIRDRNILIIELVFPIIILLAMFGLSKVKLISDYPAQDLDIFLYPPQSMYTIAADVPLWAPTARLAPAEFFANNVYCDAAHCNASHWLGDVQSFAIDYDEFKTNTTDYYIAFDQKTMDSVDS